MKRLFIICISASILLSCPGYHGFGKKQVMRNYQNEVNISDGISAWEMKVIAMHYLYTTSDEPCRSEVGRLHLDLPVSWSGWELVEETQTKNVCYVSVVKKTGFSFKKHDAFYVKIDCITGEPSCIGYLPDETVRNYSRN